MRSSTHEPQILNLPNVDLAQPKNNKSPQGRRFLTLCKLASRKPLVLAEGVETEEPRQLLINMGCTDFQGYLFGKPAPIGQFEALLAQPVIPLMP